ncbi:MAG TPA: 50S ribosomal protein L24 [Sphaerochaeta sp.]|jgi:large subunit ribosomal protein L24|nr:50S ribosomal protein L24 [Spirochaetota bacterium]NLV60236.1 50S ribosomal protein L24 [Spirochaetales bacterium]HOE83953.1 50S ribosomal protein L24 [Sphaerochaeta sp.]HOQ94023.1 50S ribosomal protein L24 [Sphaerochaeta sp.]HPK46799.1 50S ribosomal protein L24 [Sphaerochaeta sp.]
MKLKKNDTVVIIAGKDKGKSGKIVKIDHKRERVIVQGANMVKKAMRKKTAQDKGGIMEIEAPIHVSNLMYLTSKGEATRIGYKFDENGNKVRFAKKTGEEI